MQKSPGTRAVTQRAYILAWAAALAVLALDQTTKRLILSTFNIGDSTPILGSVVSITCRTNTGAVFGAFTGANSLIAVITALVGVAMLIAGPWFLQHSFPAIIAVGAITGGAAGNLTDRIRLGYVIDFIDLHFWPVFNIADTAITIGAIVVLIVLLRHDRQSDRHTDAESQSDE